MLLKCIPSPLSAVRIIWDSVVRSREDEWWISGGAAGPSSGVTSVLPEE